MSEDPAPAPGPADRAVELLARAMDAVGLNGTRLRWKWNRRRLDLAERSLRATVLLRSATTPHKMCRSCRALVPRSAAVCPECGAGLATVRAPGVGRLVSNVIPGATTTTSILILVNGLLFVMALMQSLAAERGGGLLSSFDGLTLIRFGSGLNVLTLGHGEWWRLLTPIFLHGGLIHFALNTYALIQIGPLVEEEYGTERFAVIYLASGVLGNVMSQVVRPFLPFFRPGVNTVGASGAICGLIGLMLVYGMRRGGAFGASIRSVMLQCAVSTLMMSFLPIVDSLCHLGGFAAGFLLGWVVPSGPFRSRATSTLWSALLLVAVGATLLAFYEVAVHGVESVRWLQAASE